MKSLSVRVSDEVHARIKERADDRGTSISAEAREAITSGLESEDLENQIDDLHDRLDRREERIQELESQLRERSQIEEKIEDLPDKIRHRESYQERRQRLLDQATLGQRVKWKVTGVPVDRIDEEQ